MRETIDVHVFTGITNPSLTYKAILEKINIQVGACLNDFIP